MKMNVSTLNDQNFMSSHLKRIHFEHLQELEMHSYEQQPCVDLQNQPCQHYMCSKMEWWMWTQQCPPTMKCLPFMHNFNFKNK